jgi:serine/threonine protein kinase
MQLGDPLIPRGYPPMQFCSPDRLHEKDPSFACDMWGYMIIFAELYLGLDSWYDQGITPDPKHDLASTIAYWRPDADPAERELVHSIMNRVFTYSPEERLTATQLLQDPSFRAIMDKYGC